MKSNIFTRIKNYLIKSTDKEHSDKETNITGSITFDIIDDKDIKNPDIRNDLIISFWSVFHVENYKNLVKNSNQPLIRPSKVFKR